MPELYAEAEYLINMPVLKSHDAGITLCAKNHWGSYNRRPDNTSYYSLHASLSGPRFGATAPGQYRAQVDAMGHSDVGGKTLLYMIDGLYGGQNWDAYPYKFQMEPFNNDWPSSLRWIRWRLIRLDWISCGKNGRVWYKSAVWMII